MKGYAVCLVVALAACSDPVATNDGGNDSANISLDSNGAEPAATADGGVPPEGRPDGDSPADRNGTSRDDSAATNRSAPASPRPGAPDRSGDQCRASDYQYLVGRHRSTIPPKPAGETWRVTCTTCPVTMDYSERRLNIFFNEQTEIVEQVRCG